MLEEPETEDSVEGEEDPFPVGGTTTVLPPVETEEFPPEEGHPQPLQEPVFVENLVESALEDGENPTCFSLTIFLLPSQFYFLWSNAPSCNVRWHSGEKSFPETPPGGKGKRRRVAFRGLKAP